MRTEPGVLGLERLELLGRLNPVEPGVQHTGMSGLVGATAVIEAPRKYCQTSEKTQLQDRCTRYQRICTSTLFCAFMYNTAQYLYIQWVYT